MTRLRLSAGRDPADDAPMSLAEAVECCSRHGFSADDAGGSACANCPLLIERRREEFLRQARAH